MKILICDDHALFRDGLELVLRELEPPPALHAVGDAEAALSLVAGEGAFDLVLLDLDLPGQDGMSAMDALRQVDPSLPVVIVSGSDRRADAVAALERGAAGYIPKTTKSQVLLGALQLVLSGGVYVPPWVYESPAVPDPLQALSPRQSEVLRLVGRGLTNQEIARVLGIGPSTVKTHLVRIFEVLEVTNRTEAAVRARELGLE